jgi:hypothetical protein
MTETGMVLLHRNFTADALGAAPIRAGGANFVRRDVGTRTGSAFLAWQE